MNEIKEPRNVRRNLSKLVVPIFIETLLIMMLGAVDTIMLSQYSDNHSTKGFDKITFRT